MTNRFLVIVLSLVALAGCQHSPQRVVATPPPDTSSDTAGSVVVQSEGQGTAYYFLDGAVRQGSWRKDAIGAPLQLLDGAWRPVVFNPGQTWIEVVPQGNAVSWVAQAVK